MIKSNWFRIRPWLTMLLGFILTGCMSLPDIADPTTMKVGGLELVSKTAESEMIVFRTPDDKEKYCMAPPPDAVPTSGEGVSFGGGSSRIGEAANLGADILGGRSPATLITRELLYRTCEISLNYKLSKKEALSLFRDTLKSITKISATLNGAGTAPLEASTSINQVKVPSSPTTIQSTSDDSSSSDEESDEETD